MADLSKIRLNGNTYNFKDAAVRERFGVCNTDGATAAKTVSISSVTSLYEGLYIFVKFTNANTQSNPTLQVNDLTAKSIKRYGTTAPSTSAASSWNAGSVQLLVYDGTYWQIADWNNTTYSGMTDAEVAAGTGTSNRLITPARLKTAIETWAPSGGGAVTSVNNQTGDVILNIPTDINDLTDNENLINGAIDLALANLDPIPTDINDLTDNYNKIPTDINDLTDTTNKIPTTYVSSFNGSSGAITYTPPITSVNGSTGAIIVDKLKTTAISENTDYNLLGTATSNTNTSVVTVYQQTPLLFSKTSTLSRLTIGTTNLPGHIRIYSDVTNASGYTDLKSMATSTNTRTISFPDATGTVALISDIPDVKSWALAADKPSYTFSELTSHPTTISGYGITDAYTKTEVDGLVSGVLHYKGIKATVSALPSSGNTIGDVWHVTADNGEYAWDGSSWQELGSTVDLSGYVPTSRTINGKALTTNISLTASDVGALPSNTTYVSSFNGSTGAITYIAPVTSVNGQTGVVTISLPTKVSDLTNDSGYLTLSTLPKYDGTVV